MQDQIAITDICSIVVTFNPDLCIVDRLEIIRGQTGQLIIVDNGSVEKLQNVIKEWAHGLSDVSIQMNTKNTGLGQALNDGLREGIDNGWEYFCTFDQDTELTREYSSTMLKVYDLFDDKLNILGCSYEEPVKLIGRGKTSDGINNNCEVATVITSGMFFTSELVSKIGYFRADFFIDSIDHEFCMRARASGSKVIKTSAILMLHKIGDTDAATGDRRLKLAYVHEPIRKYYMCRNTILTLMRYWKSDPLWSAKQLVRIVVEITSILLSENQKIVKLSSAKLGLLHGFKGLSGPRESVTRETVN